MGVMETNISLISLITPILLYRSKRDTAIFQNRIPYAKEKFTSSKWFNPAQIFNG